MSWYTSYMSGVPNGNLSDDQAKTISIRSGRVFLPRTPVSTRHLFAGRYEQIERIMDAISQIGLHAIVHGERGVGKTSLANIIEPYLEMLDEEVNEGKRQTVKVNCASTDTFETAWLRALAEADWPSRRPTFGFAAIANGTFTTGEAYDVEGIPTVDGIRKALTQLPRSVFIFDELDRIDFTETVKFTDLIKALADFMVDATVVLVGVSDTIQNLVADHGSIVRSLSQVHMPRMTLRELRTILQTGEKKLGISFQPEAATRIAGMSQGMPHYAHLIGLHSIRAACARNSAIIENSDVDIAFTQAIREAEQSIINKFAMATHSPHGGVLRSQVLLACALTASRAMEEFGFFQPADVVTPLKLMLGRDVGIPTFNKHLAEFCQEARGHVLERAGAPRTYRYRFTDALLPTYVIMLGVSSGAVVNELIEQLLPSTREDAYDPNEQLRLF